MPNSPVANVMVIDDDPRDRKILRRILENAGYGVNEVAAYHEAIDEIRRGNFEAIVLNLGPPDGFGFDLLESIQSIQPTPRVIVTTGYPKPLSDEIFESAIRRGAAGAVDKLKAQESLASLVRDALSYGDSTKEAS